jgi:hypothetical protein
VYCLTTYCPRTVYSVAFVGIYLPLQTRGRKGCLRRASGFRVYKLLSQSSRRYVRGRRMFALVRLRVDRDSSPAYDLRGLYGFSEVCLPVMSVSFALRTRIRPDQCTGHNSFTRLAFKPLYLWYLRGRPSATPHQSTGNLIEALTSLIYVPPRFVRWLGRVIKTASSWCCPAASVYSLLEVRRHL